jgi:hypothetical protein
MKLHSIQYQDKRGLEIGTVDKNNKLWLAIPGKTSQCPEHATERIRLDSVDWELMVHNYGFHPFGLGMQLAELIEYVDVSSIA